MKTTILITRPLNEARNFADRLDQMGLASFIEPMMDVKPVAVDFTNTSIPQAIIATSANALPKDIPPEFLHLPIFVMGENSAAAAAGHGFKNILSSGGHFSELLALVKARIGAGADILYWRGEKIRHDLAAALPDYAIQQIQTYQTHAAAALSPTLIEAIKNQHIGIATFFSPASAENFMKLIQQAGLEADLLHIKALSLSRAVLESMQGLRWQETRCADTPEQSALLDALKNWIN